MEPPKLIGDVTRAEREHPRYAHEAAVTLRVGAAAHQGRTTNVSRGGLCADLAAAIPIGTDIEVELRLVFEDDAQSEPLRLAARVVWCTLVDDGHQIGVAFRPLTAERAQYLTMFLRFLDDGAPAETLPKHERSVDDQFR